MRKLYNARSEDSNRETRTNFLTNKEELFVVQIHGHYQ